MKSKDQIKALATLDGWNVEPSRAHTRSDGSWGFDAKKPEWNFFHQLPNYLESYDAIIPLIQKQSRAIRASIFIRCGGDGIETPAQLCEALLRATGKWKDEILRHPNHFLGRRLDGVQSAMSLSDPAH